MRSYFLFRDCFIVAAALAAVVMDLRSYKVKNQWLLVFWSAGFLYQIIFLGASGIVRFLFGALLPVILLFPLFILRMLGPGDIKLFSVLGGVMGSWGIVKCMMTSFVCGALLAAVLLLVQGNLVSRMRYFREYVQLSLMHKKTFPYYILGERPENFHFTIAILIGVVLNLRGVF